MKPNGGPAFPFVGRTEECLGMSTTEEYRGMSLRDYFAGQALSGAFINGDTEVDDATMSRRCFELADAMLAERNKP